MDFKQSVTTCFQKYVDFSGRATRPEYWWFALLCVVAPYAVQLVLGYWLGLIVSLALMLPSLAAGARRLHDINKTGWLQLVWLVPVLGWAFMIYLLVQPTVAGSNQYGEAPVTPDVPAAPGVV